MKIEQYLITKGIRPNTKGFDYLVSAIDLTKTHEKFKNSKSKIYDAISDLFNDKKNNIARLINYSISSAGLKCSNYEFIARAVIELKSLEK